MYSKEVYGGDIACGQMYLLHMVQLGVALCTSRLSTDWQCHLTW